MMMAMIPKKSERAERDAVYRGWGVSVAFNWLPRTTRRRDDATQHFR